MYSIQPFSTEETSNPVDLDEDVVLIPHDKISIYSKKKLCCLFFGLGRGVALGVANAAIGSAVLGSATHRSLSAVEINQAAAIGSAILAFLYCMDAMTFTETHGSIHLVPKENKYDNQWIFEQLNNMGASTISIIVGAAILELPLKECVASNAIGYFILQFGLHILFELCKPKPVQPSIDQNNHADVNIML